MDRQHNEAQQEAHHRTSHDHPAAWPVLSLGDRLMQAKQVVMNPFSLKFLDPTRPGPSVGAEAADPWSHVARRSSINEAEAVELRYPNYRRIRIMVNPTMRLFMRLRMRGLHHVPRRGPVILAANHLSHVDPVMVIMASRRKAHYLAKDGHFESGPRRWLMRATGQIETNRESGAQDALESAVALLALEGRSGSSRKARVPSAPKPRSCWKRKQAWPVWRPPSQKPPWCPSPCKARVK